MNIECAENDIITLSKQTRLIHSEIMDEEVFENAELLFPVPKRFGLADLWKIQGRKRYANVYPRRVY